MTITEKSYTPWGEPQSVEEVAEGITFVSTASHGGYHLSPEKNQVVNEIWRRQDNWYEEDCDWAIVAITFPEFFTKEDVSNARRTAINWLPDEYMAVTGKKIAIAESKTLSERAFFAANSDKYIVISAVGDWHEKVPEGQVAVYAAIGGKRNDTKNEKCFLVHAEEYEKRSGHGFVIDSERHKEIEPIYS